MEVSPAFAPDTTATDPQLLASAMYRHISHQLFTENRLDVEVIDDLIAKGLSREDATLMVERVQETYLKAKRSKANKDMLWGAVWCVGGIIATAASVGFIFWGAILFGGIQFFRGVANASD
ncbi:MAG: hypothetical protein EOO11_12875 [Chitinophagaceae bacterium]|nr:MAG: hypothetical protein EOO11_12875 [Chitinophagaceae bacterium]